MTGILADLPVTAKATTSRVVVNNPLMRVGYFSFDGVLRAVLALFCALPDHVIVLRGNHVR